MNVKQNIPYKLFYILIIYETQRQYKFGQGAKLSCAFLSLVAKGICGLGRK
jgi:hypothetical protein